MQLDYSDACHCAFLFVLPLGSAPPSRLVLAVPGIGCDGPDIYPGSWDVRQEDAGGEESLEILQYHSEIVVDAL